MGSQPTGDGFLETMPAEWKVVRLGALGSFTKGRGGSKEENREAGVPVVRYGDLYTKFDTTIEVAPAFVSEADAAHYTPLPTGSILLAASGESAEDIGTAALSLLPEPAVCGGDAIVFRPADGVDPLFLTYALQSHPLRASKSVRSTGFTVVHISSGRLKTLPVPIPSLAQQRAIAEYLDRETARIDELIAEQERLLEVLTERRHAVMSSVFGAHVGAGDRLKWHIDETDIRAGERETALPLLSVSISWGVRRRDEVSNERSRAESLSTYKICSQGDLVINRMRAFQGALGLAPEEGVVSPDYAVLKIKPGVNPEWLVGAMRTSAFVSEMARRVKGIGSAELGNARTPRINISDLGEIRLRIPDRAQQDSEQAEVMRQVARLDRLALEAERLIELARERRSALITAAVTGQIDVRSGT